MTHPIRKRKCRNCNKFFRPDPRNQKNKNTAVSRIAVREARKLPRHVGWPGKKIETTFRSSENVQRVQEWRAQHPGYWGVMVQKKKMRYNITHQRKTKIIRS